MASPFMFAKKPSVPAPTAYPMGDPQGGFAYQDPLANMGFMDRIQYFKQNNPEVLGSIAQGLLQGDLGGGIRDATRAMGELDTEQRRRQQENVQQNQTKQYMLDQGYSEAEANAAMINPALFNSFMRRKENELDQEAQAKYATDGASKWSGNVEWGRTKDNRMIPLALDQRTGRLARTDGGDMTEVVDYLTPGQAAESKAIGKGSGEATVNIPMAEVDVQHSLSLADQIANDPKLPDMVGLVNSYKPNLSEESRGLQAKMDQLTGQAFLNAFRSLRGGGQITESEGFKATLAILRGDVSVGEEAYKQALKDYKAYIQMGLDAQKQVSGMNPDMNVGGGNGAPAMTGAPKGRVLSVRPKGQ